METAEFISKNYYHDDTIQGINKVRSLLSYPGVFYEGIPDNGLILVYITLSDEGLKILQSAKTVEDFDNGFSERLLQHPGHNIYVFRMVAEGKPTLKDLRRLRTRIMKKHNAPSFSWHDDHHVNLHTYRA